MPSKEITANVVDLIKNEPKCMDDLVKETNLSRKTLYDALKELQMTGALRRQRNLNTNRVYYSISKTAQELNLNATFTDPVVLRFRGNEVTMTNLLITFASHRSNPNNSNIGKNLTLLEASLAHLFLVRWAEAFPEEVKTFEEDHDIKIDSTLLEPTDTVMLKDLFGWAVEYFKDFSNLLARFYNTDSLWNNSQDRDDQISAFKLLGVAGVPETDVQYWIRQSEILRTLVLKPASKALSNPN